MTAAKLVLYSRLAFYPVHWQALEELVSRYDVEAFVLAAPAPELQGVHRAHGTAEPKDDGQHRRAPHAGRFTAAARAWLARQLREISPDAIWVQEEPIDPFLLEILALYRLRGAAADRHWPYARTSFPRPGAGSSGLRGGCSGRVSTADCRRGTVPRGHPRRRHALLGSGGPLVAGGLEPRDRSSRWSCPSTGGRSWSASPAASSRRRAGGCSSTRSRASGRVPLAVAGEGADAEALRASSAGRVHDVGLLPKDELWSFYAAIDCLVVPSLTTPRWKEQFGRRRSTASPWAFPRRLGERWPSRCDRRGGNPRPEGDAGALAEALAGSATTRRLRERLAERGRERFEREFAIPAYADKIAAALELEPSR